MPDVTVGDETIVVGEFSAQKALRALKIIRDIRPMWDRIEHERAAHRDQYAAENKMFIDRDLAPLEYRPDVLYEEQPAIDGVGLPIRDERGEILYARRPVLHEGRPVLGPDPLARISEESWEKNGQRLALPRYPGGTSDFLAYLEAGLEEFESKLFHLAALVAIPDEQILALAGRPTEITELLDKRAAELFANTPAHHIAELLVVAAEVIEDQFRPTLERLGARSETLARVMGLDRILGREKTPSTSSKPTSSTPSNGHTEPTIPEQSSVPAGVSPSDSPPA